MLTLPQEPLAPIAPMTLAKYPFPWFSSLCHARVNLKILLILAVARSHRRHTGDMYNT